MNADFLDTQLTAYLSLREALGFQIHAEQLLLPEFVAFVQAQGLTGPIRAQVALDWACRGSAHRGPGGSARRLSIARQFLIYLQAAAPETEVPDHRLLPTARRSRPYIFTPTQWASLFDAARDSRPRGSLRPHTLSTLIGLLASTGLRGGEAIRLQMTDVKLDLDPPQLHILQTKFRKSRIVPLHPSTAEQRHHYAKQRARWHYDGLADAFFVSEQGQMLSHRALDYWFLRLCRRLGMRPTEGSHGPCLTSFRHTFAVTCLRRWYHQGLDVQALLPHLSVYLGHVRPQESYGYLTAVPELLNPPRSGSGGMRSWEVTAMSSNLIAPPLQAFFADYLSRQKRLSPQTIISYRDTFRLLLIFLRDTTGIEPSALRIPDLDAPAILRFLDYLEQQRGNAVRSRNIRLSAIRSFFRLVALRDPDSIGVVTRVLAIPLKQEDKKLIGHLTRAEIQALLEAPDRSGWAGRRDHALLLTLYNSGARISELTLLKRDQVCFGVSTFLQLTGKGRKARTVPLWPETRRVLKAWFNELGNNANGIAFPSARGRPLSRDGVDYLLRQAIQGAIPACPSLATKHITPHVIRHSTALHLLQAGVDIATIALWLGHESIETTHVYLETDLALKEKALAKLDPVETGLVRFKANDPLLGFLTSL